jgi:hypothetical protein
LGNGCGEWVETWDVTFVDGWAVGGCGGDCCERSVGLDGVECERGSLNFGRDSAGCEGGLDGSGWVGSVGCGCAGVARVVCGSS